MKRPRLPIRVHLLLLVAVSALPLLGFCALLVVDLAYAQVDRFGRDVVSVARALSVAIDARVGSQIKALEELVGSPALAAAGPAAFQPQMDQAARLLDTNLALYTPDGTLVAFSGPANPVPGMAPGLAPWLRQAVQTGHAFVAGIVEAGPVKASSVGLAIPVPVEGTVRYVLASTLPLRNITAIFEQQHLPADWMGGLFDADGRFVYRTAKLESLMGRTGSPTTLALIRTRHTGWARTVTLEGQPSYSGFVTSDQTGWATGIAVPSRVVWAPLERGLLPLLAAGAVVAGCSAFAALVLARRINRPLAALARAAADPGALLAPTPAPAPAFREVTDLAEALRAAARANRAAEAALRESEAEMRHARALSPQRPWTAGPDGRLLTSSPQLAEKTGTPEGTTLGDGWSSIVHPDDVPGARAAWRHSVATGETYSTEFRIRRAAGGWSWVHARAAARLGADGRPMRWYGSTEDIDTRKQAEAALLDSRAQLQALADTLEARVAAEIAAREAAQARLVQAQRMEALGQLASGIAHDFNNVLQAVQSALMLIGRRATDPATVRRMATMGTDAAARGVAITGRLLALSRQSDLRAGPVDAAVLLGGLAEVLAHTLGASIAVRVEAAPGLPKLLADRAQLETVLINLATNARDAMPQGGRLTLRADVEQVDARATGPASALAPGRYVRLRTADSGDGMPPEVLARASEPFFTTKEVGRGTGLGLAMARGFAEQSGGALHIDSAAGEGTRVDLWLPVWTEAAAPDAAAPAGPRRSGVTAPQAGRILLVDDDAMVRDALHAQLQELGYAVLPLPDAAAALAAVASEPDIALIVSDLRMPGMDGVTLIRTAQARRPDLPAILVTGYAGEGRALAISDVVPGSVSLLQKPVSGQVLAERIALVLGEPASRMGDGAPDALAEAAGMPAPGGG